MSIAFTKYVDITSSVAASTFANQRELIGRIFTTRDLVPPQSILEYTADQLDAISSYFGSASEEYRRAVYYFSFINKNVNSPNKISYGRWVNVSSPPQIFGGSITSTLADFQNITSGTFKLEINGLTNILTSLDFSSVTSFADVATVVQTGINGEPGGPMWSSATVTYDAISNNFIFAGGVPQSASISIDTSILFILPNLLGWGSDSGAVFAYGSDSETITEALDASSNESNNFGSFLFIPDLTLAQLVEAATWNDALDNKYQFYVPVTLANYPSYSGALSIYSGCGMTLLNESVSGEFPEQFPMNILAATDYNSQNSVQSYMYQISTLTPSVTDTATSDALDAASVNYYGTTQQAGNFINFYQRGVLFGRPSNALDMNTYANEQWLKDAAGTQIMNLFLALNEIPANNKGRLIILAGLQSVIDQALFNGVISVGKKLNTAQQLYVSQISGDDKAWYQLQNIGYWVDCKIVLVGVDYIANYILIYTKDDVIRKVEGSHILV